MSSANSNKIGLSLQHEAGLRNGRDVRARSSRVLQKPADEASATEALLRHYLAK